VFVNLLSSCVFGFVVVFVIGVVGLYFVLIFVYYAWSRGVVCVGYGVYLCFGVCYYFSMLMFTIFIC